MRASRASSRSSTAIAEGPGTALEKLAGLIHAHSAPLSTAAITCGCFSTSASSCRTAAAGGSANARAPRAHLRGRDQASLRRGEFRADIDPRLVTLAILGMATRSPPGTRARTPRSSASATSWARLALQGLVAARIAHKFASLLKYTRMVAFHQHAIEFRRGMPKTGTGRGARAGLGRLRDALRRHSTAPTCCASARGGRRIHVAFRSKHLGIYRERTWRDYALLVAQPARRSQALGLTQRRARRHHGRRLRGVDDLRSRGTVARCHRLRHLPDRLVAEVDFQMRDGGAAVFIAEDQEYVDKILPSRIGCPTARDRRARRFRRCSGTRHRSCVGFQPPLSGARAGSRLARERRCPKLAPEIPPSSSTHPAPPEAQGCAIAHGKHLAAADTVFHHYPTLR